MMLSKNKPNNAFEEQVEEDLSATSTQDRVGKICGQ
jgi:hypothetical protein